MITKRPLSYWVKTSNMKLQVLLLGLILITVAARVFPLEMQKKIVNQAIGARKVDLLFLYCGLYLAAVLLASGLKYVTTVLQTHIGQEALNRIRKGLYEHILTLPLSFFQKSSPGMVVSSLVTEVANAGEFVGAAISTPAINLLTLLAFGAYMFYLNPLLAVLSLATYPIVIYLVPKLQQRSNKANKQRVDITRKISSKVDEAISGIHEIHGNDSFRIENRKYGALVDQLFRVRVIWILYKNGVKVLNNLFQNLGPFILFLVGGYLAIQGRFDLGALVAFLSAYEKLYDPWKELMEFYQVYQDASVSYERIMEYFDVAPEHLLEPPDREPYAFKGEVTTRDLSFTVPGGIQLLKQINLELKPGEQLALVGFSGSGKSTLAHCISQLHKYTGGTVEIDGHEVSDLTKMDMAKNMGIVAQSPFIFDGTIRENLLYSCEAALGKNEDPEELPTLDEMIQVLQQVGIFADVLRFGLNTILHRDREAELVEKLIRVRHNFQEEYGEELADYFEFFDERHYLTYSGIAANLIFGSPNLDEFMIDRLPENRYFLDFLDEAQLRNPLISLGRDLASMTVDILGNLPPDEVFFRNTPVTSDEFAETRALVNRMENVHLHELREEDRLMLLRLALRFTPGVHKLIALPPMMENLILEGRHLFKDKISRERPEAVTSYAMNDYIYTQTILDNILFGKQTSDHPKAQERIGQSIVHLLVEEDLLEKVVEIGMEFNVGTKGDRLSGGQRQKLAIARVFLKNPPILVMDEATSALDNASQKRIQNLLETRWKGKSTLIAVVHRLDTIKGFDKVAVMKAGKIAEFGAYDELISRKGLLYELVHGPRASA
ncbi:ABC transporter ATP-binding protein/permease [Syntrophobacter fumaroxidans]|uniref:ABC transporter related n=1 Tax=Syntrophobacter fumaroxidans (strain DSM 10017 / MPOB) TaxID=335543 RepID=A0LQJ5_SYNFM|nr:ABC transporter ATP-binding protein/permease [Syntrophobacter fumaroxidans]ABK19697.1 ABC transporter related [Syntrophobacter fumaroxidans MPOB]